MTRRWNFLLLSATLLGAGCPGDDSSGDDANGSSTGGSATTDASTGTPGTTSGPNPTSGMDTTAGTDPSTTTGEASGSDSGSGTGPGVDCTAIAPGPLAAQEVFAPGAVFNGSEDITFDGQGGLAGKNGDDVVLVSADGNVLDTWADPGPAYGLRYRSNGELLAAHFMSGEIIDVTTGTPVASGGGIGGVNGLWADFDGRVWFTNFSAVQRLEADNSITPIASGGQANSANGVIYDPDRGYVYYTNYGAGQLWAMEIMGDGSPGAAVSFATIAGAALDGLNLDACGNLYAVDQGNSRLYRVYLDEFGGPIGDPEVLIDAFPANVANVQWGIGDGWDEHSLYAAGVPGGVYRVQVGIPGFPVPTP